MVDKSDIAGLIKLYFPQLTKKQYEQYTVLSEMIKFWNSRINLISRKDIHNIGLHHILHSLAVAKIIRFSSSSYILDAGTGGGFPGLPLAIMFPDVNFKLTDSTGKKIKVVKSLIKEVGLMNTKAFQVRIEEERGKFDFVVCRAVTKIPEIVRLIKKNISAAQKNTLANGLLYLKGGDTGMETEQFSGKAKVFDISNFFKQEFFATKKVIYIPL
jgi:16S rRNA (guanine527-N7)-methyltransferase